MHLYLQLLKFLFGLLERDVCLSSQSVSTEKLLAPGTIYKDSGKGNSKKKVATLLFHSIRWCGIYRKLLFVDNALKMENK